jgi:hypothetical protein
MKTLRHVDSFPGMHSLGMPQLGPPTRVFFCFGENHLRLCRSSRTMMVAKLRLRDAKSG